MNIGVFQVYMDLLKLGGKLIINDGERCLKIPGWIFSVDGSSPEQAMYRKYGIFLLPRSSGESRNTWHISGPLNT
jgi:hypothetical protein